MNPDDASLFLDAMGDVEPLKGCTDIHWQPSRNPRAPARIDTLQLDNFLSTGFLEIVPLNEPLAFHREGLQQGVTDKLRSGKYPQQASLNLFASAGRNMSSDVIQFYPSGPTGGAAQRPHYSWQGTRR